MMVMECRFYLASDFGIILSFISVILTIVIEIIGIIKSCISVNKKNIYIICFGLVMTGIIIVLLYLNYTDINKNYVKIPNILGLSVDSAKVQLADNGVNINNVNFKFISSESLLEGETKIIEVEPACEEYVKKMSEINILCEDGNQKEDSNKNIPPKELIVAINEQLSDEGLALDEEDLKAFICMLNGNYEFINEECFYRVLESVCNLDIGAGNILGGTEVTDNHMSSISAILGAFSREKDALFAKYWITRFENLKSEIYNNENMESVYHEIDEFAVDLYLAFCCFEPVSVDNERISLSALREETVFFLQEFLVRNIIQYLEDIHGNNSQQYLEMENPSLAEKSMISVGMMIDELNKNADDARANIFYKLQDY